MKHPLKNKTVQKTASVCFAVLTILSVVGLIRLHMSIGFSVPITQNLFSKWAAWSVYLLIHMIPAGCAIISHDLWKGELTKL